MKSFAVVGILAFLVAAVARPTVAETTPGSPGVNPPRATAPPAPVAPSSPLTPLNPQRTTVARPTHPTTMTRMPSAAHRTAAPHVQAAHLR